MRSLILLFSLLVPVAGAVSAQPEELRMWMTVGERRFAVTLTDNAAARALRSATAADAGHERTQWQ